MSSISHPHFFGHFKDSYRFAFPSVNVSKMSSASAVFLFECYNASAENPSTRTFSGEFNFYDTLRSIQFSIRRLFSQNLNGLGNKKSLCGHHSITHSTTVRAQDTEPDLFAAILKPIFSALGHLEIDLKMPKLYKLPVKRYDESANMTEKSCTVYT